ncbi:virulence factor SrfB [Larkinella sp. GY13]|uniref:virulence factor SrfB n=1 Tax=Larkinella sp. GY13 TaxID=3453720 RepID=UPI003EECF44A
MNMVSLIANSGIQFIDIPLNLGDTSAAPKLRFEYAEQEDPDNDRVYLIIPYMLENGKYISRLDINAEAFRPDRSIDESKIRPENLNYIREDHLINLQGRYALDVLEGVWLPLPYFRTDHYDAGKLMPGPQSWARMYLGRISSQEKAEGSPYTHKLVLAFDTHCDDKYDPRLNHTYYVVPDSSDPEGGNTRFKCATHEDTNGFFLSQKRVNDWLEEVITKRKSRIPRQLTSEPHHLLHLGLYMTLLKMIEQTNSWPVVTLQQDALGRSIDVNLVLDVGNSRTCGLVLESSARERDAELALTDAKRLKIRELRNPTHTSNKPFEMKLAFMEASFGKKEGLTDDFLFRWPSMVRVGTEATRYGVIFGDNQAVNDQYEMTFSSPKRYLWDAKKREKPWGYFSEHTELMQNSASSLPLANLFTSDGMLVDKANKLASANGPGLIYRSGQNPLYARSALMTFALTEILLQTLSYINSYEFRNERGEAGVPRRLRRIVLTCPTAMPKTERVKLRECAADALQALRDYYGDKYKLISPDLEIIPDYSKLAENDPVESRIPKNLKDLRENHDPVRLRTSWGYDEATCSQLVFMYNEIVHRFGPENAPRFFETMGRRRTDDLDPSRKSLMIASVDIGGGTTDLMIGHYEYEPGAVTSLYQNPVFWEGFNLAGDHIIKKLIEECVLPQIAREARRLGCGRAGQVLYSLFGPFQSTDTDHKRTLKKHFANQVATVIAQGMLGQITAHPDQTRQVAFDEFFQEHEAPIPSVLQYVNEGFRREGATGFDIRLMSWEVSPEEINQKAIRNVIGTMLRDLCGIISQYQCDYVLLSGRPSTLPVVLDLFLENMPVSPDRIVPMNRIRVATSEKFWYPFSDPHEYTIKDPKTCVSVGAAIALLSELGHLNGFRLDTRLLAARMTSTADYIGLLTDGQPPRIKNEHVLAVPDDSPIESIDEIELTGAKDTFLGMRQMASDQWIATPLYKIEFDSERARTLLMPKLPLKVRIGRPNLRDKEGLILRNNLTVMDPQTGRDIPALKLTVCTLTDPHGYWLDTGNFYLDPYLN